MLVSKYIDDIQQSPAYILMPAEVRPDRRKLLAWMSSELNELAGQLPDADWFQVWLEPAISTSEGEREYDLPEDFPANFVRLDNDRWACNLDTGTCESNLRYRSLREYYDQNLRAQSNGKPESYTIKTRSDGRRQLVLSPPPDGNSGSGYTIDGLYCPTDWTLSDEDEIPPIPNSLSILKWGVLRRINPELEPKYREAYSSLLLEVARNRKIRLSPNYGAYSNQYARMRMS